MKKTLPVHMLAILSVMLFAMLVFPGASRAGDVLPEKLALSGSHDLAKGMSIQLTAVISPAEASQKVKWESGDPSVATVDKHGLVTGVRAGQVTITATARENPDVRKKWKLTVYSKPVKKIKISALTKTVYLDARKSLPLEITISPIGGSETIEWKSSDRKIAAVSKTGVVTAKKPGTVTITARTVDGSDRQASITLTVEKKEPPLQDPDPELPTNYYALLIANSDYTAITRLPSTKNDQKAMKTALAGMSQKWKITARKNLTGDQIASAIATAFEGATANDICLFYYSGHGCEDMDYYPGALMGITYNGDAEESDLLSVQRLKNALDRACPGKVIVMLEACGSGAVIYDGQPLSWDLSGKSYFSNTILSAFRNAEMVRTGELLSNKYTVLTTCEHGDYGVNLPVVSENIPSGLLTYCTVRAMGCSYPDGSYTGSMAADSNGDRSLTLGELKSFDNTILAEIKSKFPDDTTQVFQYHGDNDMVLFSR